MEDLKCKELTLFKDRMGFVRYVPCEKPINTIMNIEKLKHQLFIGKVQDILGMKKTVEIIKEVKEAFDKQPTLNDVIELRKKFPNNMIFGDEFDKLIKNLK